ncbi:proprotein convertase subtilisin/kexin type 5 [Brienomyrus brachyistius]|uniref:proprotein convertase subtilisin/kexin type 5 n=1 Tax=Brienomyrus brachyistius TaxID=42636 RepID=UPI0020B45DDE|nr:proprotein convertase subtilisin/kexin type 5 [Brienomyrus brachyistius]
MQVKMQAGFCACLFLCWLGHVQNKPSSFHCPSGQFLTKNQCVGCHATCSECMGHELFQCTSCGIDKDGVERFLHQGRCRLHCPRGYYPTESHFTCQPCLPDCELCTDANTCTQCRENYTAQSGTCQPVHCGDGQTQDPETGECADCGTGCRTCSTDEPEVCRSCTRGYFFYKEQCRRGCPQGTFEDAGRRLCLSCPAPCVDCWSGGLCLTCLAGHFLNRGACVKQCPDGAFGDTGVWRCQACHSSCQTCHGPGAQDCDTCEDGHLPLYGQCPAGSCPHGRYFDSMDGECRPCDESCKTCFGPTALECSTCLTGSVLDPEGSCVTRCPPGFFANMDAQLCEECSPSCETCEGVGDLCTSCRKDSHWLFLHQGKCWSSCPDGYFESPAGRCETCDSSCLTCDGSADHCLSCVAGLYLEGGRCGSLCSPRSYPAGDGTCAHCPTHCEACANGRTCDRCSFLYLLLDGVCKASCPEGYFEDLDQGLCVPCHPSCASCSGPEADDCASCTMRMPRLYQGSCSVDCPVGTYYQSAVGECQDCDQTCMSCSGPEATQCTQCKPGLVLDPNTMRCGITGGSSCPPRTFLHKDGFSCLACHSSCSSCVGPGASQCETCTVPRYLYNGSCVSDCPAGSYSAVELFVGVKLGVCSRCDPVCSTCMGSSPKDCLTCTDGYFQLLHLCLTHCPTGYYSEAAHCEPCDNSCESCSSSGPDACLSCPPSSLEVLGTGRCAEHCAHGLFQLGRTCRLCHASCQTCRDASPQGCLSCHWGNKLQEGMCHPRCEERRYLTEDERCEPCDQSCRTCSGPGPSQCLTCPRSHALHASENRCVTCCEPWSNSTDCCPCVAGSVSCVEPPTPLGEKHGGVWDQQPQAVRHVPVALTTVLLLGLALGLTFLLLAQARTRKWFCWRRSYETLSGSAQAWPTQDRMSHGVEDPSNMTDEAEVVYSSRDGTLYRRYNFLQDPETEAEEEEDLDENTSLNRQ